MDQSRQHDKSVSHSYLGLPSRYCCDLLPIGVYLHLGYNSICVIVTMRVPNPQRSLRSLHRNLLKAKRSVFQFGRPTHGLHRDVHSDAGIGNPGACAVLFSLPNHRAGLLGSRRNGHGYLLIRLVSHFLLRPSPILERTKPPEIPMQLVTVVEECCCKLSRC